MTFLLLLNLLFTLFIMPVNADTTYKQGIIAKGTSEVSFRSCANKNCAIIKNDNNTGIYLSHPENFEILGEESNFYKIKLQNNGFWYEGYISKGTTEKNYVEVKEVTVLDSDINNYQTLGFPLSYASKLAILKALHPTWEFTIYNVDATWDEVIAGETKYINTNLISGSNTLLRNTEDGAYIDGKYTEFSGGEWYSPSKQVVKYYVDPRNFLNDGHVFMFEVLSFDEKTQTIDAIQSLLNGTFMKDNTFYYNDQNEKQEISYAQTFIDAGKTNKMSSIHLVSRVIQEQGSNGSALSSGDNAEFPGYYNYFNVKANGQTTADVIHNGLAYAKKQNWNSPYASIIGGGNLLKNYVDYGQNTLYLQKFDFAGSTYYTNQYMQNIRAPYSESYTTYKTYVKNGFLESKFLFSIPVFKGSMPELTSLANSFNEDSSLGFLEVVGCNLMPSFNPNAYNYTCYVDKETAKVTVNAISTNSSSTIKGLGDFDLNGDETTIEVTVTSEAKTASTYKINIKKQDGNVTPDEILSKLQISNDKGYISGFDLGSDAKSLNDLIKFNYPLANSIIDVQDKLSTGMTLKLTSNMESNYTIVIYGDNNGDGIIDIVDLLKTQKHILNVGSLQDAYYKASDVNKDGTVDIVDLLKIQKHILNVNQIEQ